VLRIELTAQITLLDLSPGMLARAADVAWRGRSRLRRFSNLSTVVLSVALASVFGYALTSVPLLVELVRTRIAPSTPGRRRPDDWRRAA